MSWLGSLFDTVTKPLDWTSSALGSIPGVGNALSSGFNIGKYFIPGVGQYMGAADAMNALGDKMNTSGQPKQGGVWDDYSGTYSGGSQSSSGSGFDWEKWLPYIYGTVGGISSELGSSGQMQRALADMYKSNIESQRTQDQYTQEQIKAMQDAAKRSASLDPLVADQMRNLRSALAGNSNVGMTSKFYNRG